MTFDRIVSSPDVLGGAPRIDGTRISVSMVLEWVASGADRAQILDAYPHLEAEDVEQALLYAARFLENEKARFRLKHYTVLGISDFLHLGRRMFPPRCTDQ